MSSEVRRLQFDSNGKPAKLDRELLEFSEKKVRKREEHLKTSSELSFLREQSKLENVYHRDYWSLYKNEELLEPLKFSNGKTQEDVVREVVDLVESGKKIIFLHGVCGTGKSAIALNISRVLGKSSIVVPIKSLQKQYEKDYAGDMYLVKSNKEKLKIAMITGRDNHDSVIMPGISCADPNLPDNIKLTEKNYQKLKEYYMENPYLSNPGNPEVKNLRRISVAPANPYWSPILPASVELNHFKDAKKKKYVGLYGDEFVFYHRKPGCSYYDQYLSYMDSDVIIFNSAKYLAEVSLRRKPKTDIEIIDEADEFLDNLSNQFKINLTRFSAALKMILSEDEDVNEVIRKLTELVNLEEKNKRILGIIKDEVYELEDTKIYDILKILSSNKDLESEIIVDDSNYANQVLEAAGNFIDSMDDTYVSFEKEDDSIFATLVTTNLAKKFKKIVDGSRALVLMSGTLQSEEVLKKVFGVEDYSIVEAEALNQGAMEIDRTGTEFDCKYSNFVSENHTREDYLKSLSKVVERAKKPALVQVNAFSDLPSEDEIQNFEIDNLVSQEQLRIMQEEDKSGNKILDFKKGLFEVLFTTKCSRGIDFPGDTCNSVVFTKYPNPNIQGTFWQILKKTHPDYFWEFYKDKANREFLQRIYRALRSKDDHVYILSPDTRVLDKVRELQLKGS
ncbi:MAG: helicase C-terminal domain-containing protein [Candidatus Pacearchaeota archaeon]